MARRDPDCIFCKIVAGSAPIYKVWEDDNHLAFLTRHPNTEGYTVLITKDHHGSYFADLPPAVLSGLVAAARTVARQLDAKLDDVGRTGLIFEGFGVNHIHAKLVPMHGTRGDWQQRVSPINTYFNQYPGYISSHDVATEASPQELERVAKKLTG